MPVELGERIHVEVERSGIVEGPGYRLVIHGADGDLHGRIAAGERLGSHEERLHSFQEVRPGSERVEPGRLGVDRPRQIQGKSDEKLVELIQGSDCGIVSFRLGYDGFYGKRADMFGGVV